MNTTIKFIELADKFVATSPIFQKRIIALANNYGTRWEKVYALWRQYSSGSTSALLSEFEQAYCDDLRQLGK